MDSVYETLLNRLLEEVKNEDIKKGINIALSAYMDSGYITRECKENYFRDRFAKVKKMVADMDLDEFSNSDLFTLRDAIQDDWGNMVYEDSMMPFDQFIRTSIPDTKYYIGNIIYLH